MSRSAKDATRFTPNTPQAYSRGPAGTAARSSSGASPSFKTSSASAAFAASGAAAHARPETPQEKVARLRAEHVRRRAAQLSGWDKVVLRGRNVADAAHRWTILGILTFSVLAGGLTVFSAVDMIAYNRRKKREFYKEYQKLWEQRHADALEAQAVGTATETQMAIINQEQTAQDFHTKRESQSVWKRVKGFFSFQGLSNGETTEHMWERRKALVNTSEPTLAAAAVTSESDVVRTIEEQRRRGEKVLENQAYMGGELDRLAANVADAVSPRTSQGKSWFSFGGRG